MPKTKSVEETEKEILDYVRRNEQAVVDAGRRLA